MREERAKQLKKAGKMMQDGTELNDHILLRKLLN